MAASSTASLTVSNATSVASSVVVNSGSAITLTAGTTTNVNVAATVTDNNSCKDLVTVDVALYKQGATCTQAGHADNDVCYWYTVTSPSTDPSCADNDDLTFALSYNFSVQYYADPGSWLATVKPYDESAGTPDSSSTVTLNDLQSIGTGGTVALGTVAPNAASIGDHTETITNAGNVAVNFNASSAALTCATRGSIAANYIEYALATFTYGDGTDFSGTPTAVEADLAAPEDGTVPVTDLIYLQAFAPTGTEGLCSGNQTYSAIAD